MNNIKLTKENGLILGLSLVFIAVGISRGEMQTVFTKAVSICLECIGIG